jgi:hypothetical protein
MALYVLAKVAEVLHHEIANTFGFVSGHTLKHVIAPMATAAVVWGVRRRFSARSFQDGWSYRPSPEFETNVALAPKPRRNTQSVPPHRT